MNIKDTIIDFLKSNVRHILAIIIVVVWSLTVRSILFKEVMASENSENNVFTRVTDVLLFVLGYYYSASHNTPIKDEATPPPTDSHAIQ